jgi:hypothetical protein
VTVKNLEHLQRVARAHAKANRTDPFAYRRMLTHLLNGIEEAGPVLASAKHRGGGE